MPRDPSLVDFLLARIAEDEEWAALYGCVDAHEGTVLSPNCRDHVFAQCEAKGRIIDMWRLAPPVADLWLTPVLDLIALSYADHPDFRDEWRAKISA